MTKASAKTGPGRAGYDPDATVVRSAVAQTVGHVPQGRLVDRPVFIVNNTRDSAHGYCFLLIIAPATKIAANAAHIPTNQSPNREYNVGIE